MEVYLNKWEAVIGLHESGFTEDFVFSGNNIFWLQQKLLFAPEDITLIELYRFSSPAGNQILIFGVIAKCSGARGILISHCKLFKNKNQPVFNAELIKTNSRQMEYSYAGVL